MLTAGECVGCACKNPALMSNLGVSPRRDWFNFHSLWEQNLKLLWCIDTCYSQHLSGSRE